MNAVKDLRLLLVIHLIPTRVENLRARSGVP